MAIRRTTVDVHEHSGVSKSVRSHRHGVLALVACYLAGVSWVLLSALILIMVAGFISHSDALTMPFVLLLSAFMFSASGYCVAAVAVRCSSCGRRFLIETPGAKHAKASRVWGFDHWATSIVEILRRGRCTCMYCGVEQIVASARRTED